MRKILLVTRHEIITLVFRFSFVFATFGLPLIGLLFYSLVVWLGHSDQPVHWAQLIFQAVLSQSQSAQGYVDESGLIQVLPPDLPAGKLTGFPDEAAARAALEAGSIQVYCVVSKDYLQSGAITCTRRDFNFLTILSRSPWLERALALNLLQGDVLMASRFKQPLVLERISHSPVPVREASNPLTLLVPYLVNMLFMFTILGNADLMLVNVVAEKDNRLLEILLASISPRQLLIGKIIGLGVVGTLPLVVWLVTGVGLLNLGGQTFDVSAVFQLPLSFVLWGVVFFLLGYALYASLMAGLGALVPEIRETSLVAFVVSLPMLISTLFLFMLIREPNIPLSVGLSLFPLTAPMVMMTRLAAGGVPGWQPLLAAALLLITLWLVIRLAARIFQAQTLLSGQPFQLRRVFEAL